MASSEITHQRAQAFIFEALHLNAQLPTTTTAQLMLAEDWDYLLKIAKEHRLGAMLHNRLKRDDLAQAIPEQVITYLKSAYRKSALRSLVVYRELAKVTQLLEAEGIASIALKGAYLARFAYPDPALRPMRDLDLLLKQEEAVKAFELLQGCGYRSPYPTYKGLPESFLDGFGHLLPLTSPDGICIELHYQLLESDIPSAQDFEYQAWEKSISRRIAGTEIRFLCSEDLLLHLCIHATIRHHFNLGALALADVAFLVKTHPIDWQKFLGTVSTGGWRRCALALLYLAKRNLGADIPDEVIEALGGQECDVAWLEIGEYLLFSELAAHHALGHHFYKMLSPISLWGKISTFVKIVFPPRTVIALNFPVNARSTKAFLYYPLRWHQLMFDKLPLLFKPRLRQEETILTLAKHRTTFNDWLSENPPH
ncbi:MAG: nucleotidyltransferase family protein [Gallionella sp.]|nr:nucleotidyltransferase family protein [Gallionella sp.]MDD4958634.1 nucleotidyltransferase family protein [Gallionella sp.]